MSYYRLVISRAFAKTKEVWNLHQVWKYGSTPVSAVLLRLAIKRLSPVMGWEGFLKEALLFSVCGFIVSWVGELPRKSNSGPSAHTRRTAIWNGPSER